MSIASRILLYILVFIVGVALAAFVDYLCLVINDSRHRRKVRKVLQRAAKELSTGRAWLMCPVLLRYGVYADDIPEFNFSTFHTYVKENYKEIEHLLAIPSSKCTPWMFEPTGILRVSERLLAQWAKASYLEEIAIKYYS